MSGYLGVVEECDNFPRLDSPDPLEAAAYREQVAALWLFFLPDDPEPHGFLTDAVVARMPWGPDFRLATAPRKEVHLRKNEHLGPDGDWPRAARDALQALVDRARAAAAAFPRLGPKSPELFPVLGARFDVAVERPAFSLFGLVGRGAHMTVYTRTASAADGRDGGGYRVCVARRSRAKAAFPGMLDQAVAGGVARGETPRQCILREAHEEANLDPDAVRRRVVAAGTVSWLNVSDETAGGEPGLINPGVLYVYDLELREDDQFVFRAVEGDIEGFTWMTVPEVEAALRQGEFKPSCAMVMLDFLVRHGLITAENEPDYHEIVSRLHRRLPFRTSPGTPGLG